MAVALCAAPLALSQHCEGKYKWFSAISPILPFHLLPFRLYLAIDYYRSVPFRLPHA